MLTQEHLAHVLFPVGEYTKTEVRQLAQKYNLPVASKSESQDLCFLGDGDYRRFLREYGEKTAVSGPILTSDGKSLGEHQGLPSYTIGQRKGLGISTPQPVFVLRKDIQQNALIVGTREELGQTALVARDVSWISGSPPPAGQIVEAKIRYKAQPIPATIEKMANGRFRVKFQEPVFGITAGQGAVFFDGEQCLGGGIIDDNE
jgi:tRNA-specific 2-thiouridylase